MNEVYWLLLSDVSQPDQSKESFVVRIPKKNQLFCGFRFEAFRPNLVLSCGDTLIEGVNLVIGDVYGLRNPICPLLDGK